MMEGISCDGKGSECENVLLEPRISLETSSVEVRESLDIGTGALGGKISIGLDGVMDDRIVSTF